MACLNASDLGRDVIQSPPHLAAALIREQIFGRRDFVWRRVPMKPAYDWANIRVVRSANMSDALAGLLLPRDTPGFDVLVPVRTARSDAVERRRLRFTLAHELAHTFFFDRRSTPHRRPERWTEREEHFCNALASHLLVPRDVLSDARFSADLALDVRDRYDVSLHAASLAVAESTPGTFIGGVQMKDHPTKGLALRLAWSAGTVFVPANARLRSAIAELAWDRGAASGWEDLSIGRLRGTYWVQALRERGSRQVLVAARPPSDVESGQLELFT